MPLNWTEIPLNSEEIILSSLMEELASNMDSLAKYMDTKEGNNYIYRALDTHKGNFPLYSITKYRDKLYSSVDTLNSKKVCVPYHSTYYPALNSSCYSDLTTNKDANYSSKNTSVNTSKYGTH